MLKGMLNGNVSTSNLNKLLKNHPPTNNANLKSLLEQLGTKLESQKLLNAKKLNVAAFLKTVNPGSNRQPSYQDIQTFLNKYKNNSNKNKLTNLQQIQQYLNKGQQKSRFNGAIGGAVSEILVDPQFKSKITSSFAKNGTKMNAWGNYGVSITTLNKIFSRNDFNPIIGIDDFRSRIKDAMKKEEILQQVSNLPIGGNGHLVFTDQAISTLKAFAKKHSTDADFEQKLRKFRMELIKQPDTTVSRMTAWG
jgi:uncharacterized protein YneF (UPF0154 family)